MSTRKQYLTIGLVVLIALAGCSSLSGGEGTATPGVETTTTAPAATPAQTPTETAVETTQTETTVRETPTETPDEASELSDPSPPASVETLKTQSEWASTRTIAGNVSKLSVTMPQFDNQSRGVWVYVPPGYSSGDERYPVVYMQDGQNLFDDEAAFKGEWQVDETMQRLASEKGLEAIVVGVENAGMTAGRGDEYLPWESQFNEVGGNGSQYAAFLAETLKPTIDHRYRTDPDNATLVGSSYGGVISLYTAFEYPERFQYVGGMSNAHSGVPELYDFLNESGSGPDRVYVDWGTDELNYAEQFDRANHRLTNVTAALGYERGETLLAVEEQGGGHSEAYWSERFPRAIEWLLTGEDPA